MTEIPLPNLDALEAHEKILSRIEQRETFPPVRKPPQTWLASSELTYDPNESYTRSTNAHDHSTTVRVPFPREVVAMVQRVVNSGAIPRIRSIQDYIRNAVVHRLHHDAEFISALEPSLTLERAACVLDAIEDRTRAMDELIARARRLGERYIALGAMELLSDLAWRIEEISAATPEPYRTALEKELAQWADAMTSGNTTAHTGGNNELEEEPDEN